MKPVKRIAAIIYLLACLVILGSYAASHIGATAARMAELGALLPFRIAVAVCLGIIGIQALYVLGLVIFDRPEPKAVRPVGNPGIEVTTTALAAVARAAARGDDLLIEDVEARVRGREQAAVDVRVEAIALDGQDLNGMGARLQERVARACEQMLGAPGVTVRVRFLPTKTVTATREVSGE